MHVYYTNFDWLTDQEIDEVLREDGVPETLFVHDVEDEDERTAVASSVFQEWIWEGRYDCAMAQRLTQLWILTLRGSPHDTLADFYEALLRERREAQSEGSSDDVAGKLPLSFLASLVLKWLRAFCHFRALRG